MRVAGLLLALVVGCVDPMDGDIETPEGCCVHFPFEEPIVRCLEALLPDDPDACIEQRCVTVEAFVCHGASEAQIWEDS